MSSEGKEGKGRREGGGGWGGVGDERVKWRRRETCF